MPKAVKQTRTKRRTTKKPVGIEAKIQDSVHFEEEGIKILLYGRSGTGKTTLWSSFPKPILAIVASGGMKAGELRSIPKSARKDVKPFYVENSTEIEDLVELIDGGEEFQTVVLDHCSGLQDRIMAEILNLKEMPAQSSWGLATQQQYGQCALQMKEHLRRLLGLSCNVVLIAQERDFNTDKEDSDLLMPYVAAALSPSVVGWLNPAVDYICQTFLRMETVEKRVKVAGKTKVRKETGEKVEYCLRTEPHPVFTTKFRVPKGKELPDVIVDPDYDKIMALIEGD